MKYFHHHPIDDVGIWLNRCHFEAKQAAHSLLSHACANWLRSFRKIPISPTSMDYCCETMRQGHGGARTVHSGV